jgi:membrane protease YdiL (CAAX protease family)
VKTQVRRRLAALLEVLGVLVAGAFLNDKLVQFLAHINVISTVSPFSLLTVHATDADLVLASRQLFIALVLIYLSYFLLIIPITLWNGQRGVSPYGLTRAGLPWKTLLTVALATSALTQWPVLVHGLVDAVHPLGPMAPWRQAFFDMSWHRWQFWLFAGVLSYAVIPIVEELLFRGYCQQRLAKDWGDGPAIVAVACMFTFSHKQYLIANAYNITQLASLFILAIGLGVAFAWTRSLFPSMVAHAIINVPLTPRWQAVLLALFVVGILCFWNAGYRVFRQVFRGARMILCLGLACGGTLYVLKVQQLPEMSYIAMGMVGIAIILEAKDRLKRSALE